MRILIISNNEISYNPRLLKAADYFSQQGAEVFVFNPIVGIGTEEVYNDAIANKGWHVFENNISKRTFSSKVKWFYVSIIQSLSRKLYKHAGIRFMHDAFLNKGLIGHSIDVNKNYDFILINLVDNLPYAVKLKRKTGAKIIYDSQEYFVGQYQKYDPIQLKWVMEAEKENIHEVDTLIATTHAMKDQLEKDYQLTIPSFRVRNVPSEKMLPRATNKIENEDVVYLVWHGMTIFLENARGVHFLLEAVGRTNANVQLILQGFINEEQKILLDKYITRLSLQGKVILKPAAHPYEIISSLTHYDIGLIGELAEEDNQRLTSSNKLFDYLHAGLAVIAPDLPGLNETVKDNGIGLTYKVADLNSLVHTIESLASNRKLLLAYQQNGFCLASREMIWEKDYFFVWEEMKELVAK
jgi:glycosyltransferase involved in cell wall biosynthesis